MFISHRVQHQLLHTVFYAVCGWCICVALYSSIAHAATDAAITTNKNNDGHTNGAIAMAEPKSSTDLCLAAMYPQSAGFFGALGAAVALVFANLGSAYGAAKSGVGVAYLGLNAPEKIMRGIVPVVMAGILGIYGLIIAVIINNNIKTEENSYSAYAGYLHLGAGVAAGLAALAAGLSIGVVGDTAARAYGKQDQIFVAMVLMLIFSEALGLYGLIIALLMNNQANRYSNLCGV